MTRERQYVLHSQARSPSPPRRRHPDFSPSPGQKYLSGDVDYLRARDGKRKFKSPPGRTLDLQAERFSDYYDRDGERGGESDSYKYKDVVGHSRRLYRDDSFTGDPASMKSHQDYGLEYPQNSNGFNVKSYANDCHGVSDTNITRLSGERDYYSGSRYLDDGRSQFSERSRYLRGGEPYPMETERTKSSYTGSYTLGHGSVDALPKSVGGYDIGARQEPSMDLQYLSNRSREDGDFHSAEEHHLAKKGRDIKYRDNFCLDKKDGHFRSGDELKLQEFVKPNDRQMYKYNGADDLLSSRGYLRGDVDHTMSPSQPKDYARVGPGFSSREDLYLPSNGTRLKTRMTSETIGCDGGIGNKSQNRSPMTSQDVRSPSRSNFGSLDERHGSHSYLKFSTSDIGSDIGCSSTRSSEFPYGKALTDGEAYRRHDSSRTDFIDPKDVIDESSRTHIKDELRDHHAYLRGQFPHNNYDVQGPLCARKQDDGVSGYDSICLSYDAELYQYEGIKPREQHSNQMDRYPLTCEERSNALRLKEYEPCYDRIDERPCKRLAARDLSLAEKSERKLKQKHVIGEKLHKHGVGRKGVCNSYHQRDGGEDVDPVRFSNKFKSNRYHEKMRDASKISSYPSTSEFILPNQSTDQHTSRARDIKRRLGPRLQKLHVTERIGKKCKPSSDKRLRPASKIHARLPWVENLTSKTFRRVQDDSDGNLDDVAGDRLEDNVLDSKLEPPEKSDEFKQLVQTAFFKFLKQICETPIKRKAYTEQVKNRSLKCLICGSNSEEFVDAQTLAMHAFTSTTVGLRSQHLGLHKALCVLMGWKTVEDFNTQWLCEVKSDAETSSVKEDLIIWPPVVVIHNSTIEKKNPDNQVILAPEALETKLKVMGFGCISKVCLGKPANQSVMLAKFNGTLSGLQEAERLHKKFLDTKNGRTEFLQLMSSEEGSCSEETQTVAAEKEENFLYCYLGLVEDLDKLDFNTKKRCVVRSKTEMHCIADAPLNTK